MEIFLVVMAKWVEISGKNFFAIFAFSAPQWFNAKNLTIIGFGEKLGKMKSFLSINFDSFLSARFRETKGYSKTDFDYKCKNYFFLFFAVFSNFLENNQKSSQRHIKANKSGI